MGVFRQIPTLRRSTVYEKDHDPDRPWVLQEPCVYHSGVTKEDVEVPKGYKSDMASVPWVARRVFPQDGPWSYAAIVHDWFCSEKLHDFKIAALVFLEAMSDLHVAWYQRYPMYWAVRLFGPRW